MKHYGQVVRFALVAVCVLMFGAVSGASAAALVPKPVAPATADYVAVLSETCSRTYPYRTDSVWKSDQTVDVRVAIYDNGGVPHYSVLNNQPPTNYHDWVLYPAFQPKSVAAIWYDTSTGLPINNASANCQ